MSRRGRRPGLVAGHLCAAAGCLVVLAAARTGSFGLLCAGTAAFGLGNTSNLLARYAAADLSGPSAAAGPSAWSCWPPRWERWPGPTWHRPPSRWASWWACPGWPARSWSPPARSCWPRPGCGVPATRPAAGRARRAEPGRSQRPARDGSPIPRRRPDAWPPLARVALGTLVMVNVAMIAIMTMTPLHLDHAGPVPDRRGDRDLPARDGDVPALSAHRLADRSGGAHSADRRRRGHADRGRRAGRGVQR